MFKKTFKIFIFLSISLIVSCNHLFYQGDQIFYSNPKNQGLEYDNLEIQTQDGEFIKAWRIYKKGMNTKGTIVQFHGNAQNRSSHYMFVSWLAEKGYHVFVFDYRGYLDSTGSPSRKGLIYDGEAVINFVSKNMAKPIFIMAQSLGGAVAVPAFVRTKTSSICALVLESTFASYRQITREKLAQVFFTWPFQYPLSFLVTDDFSPIDYIHQVDIPILLIHGTLDQVVPYNHSLNLYEKIFPHKNKDLWVIEGGFHLSAFLEKNHDNKEKLLEYFTQKSENKKCHAK